MNFRWIFALCVPLVSYLLLYSFGVKESYRLFFAITLWATLAWAFETLPDAVVGLLVTALFITLKVATPGQVLGPWLSGVPWAILGGLAVGAVMLETGLAKRLAYWCVLLFGSSFVAILSGLMLAGIIIAPFMPSALGKMAIMSAIGIGVCDVLKLEAKSKAASAVMLTCFFAVACPALSYATGGLHVAIVVGLLGKAATGGLGWLDYAQHNWLIGMIFSAVSLLLLIVLLKPERPMEDTESIRLRYEELGAISVPEKRAMTILALILVGFVTDRMHGVDPAWIMISATAAFFLPGIRLMDGEKFSRLAFPLLFFITGAMAIGATAVTIGISKETGALFASMLSGSSFAAALFAYAFGIFSSFFIQSVALVGAFVPPLIDTAETLGISPYAVVYSFLRGTDQVIFPYQFAVLAYVCSFGYIKHSHLILVMGVRIVLDTFLLMGLAYPYWKWIGIV